MTCNGFRSPMLRGILEGYNSRESSPQESPSPEISPFRGFEKIPKVLLPRINIEPFLKKDESANRSFKKSPSIISKTYETFAKLEHSCTVRLVRDNLEQLKKELIRNSRLNKRNGVLAMSALRCKICEKSYNSEKKLQNHLENKHMLVYKSPTKAQKRVSFSDYVTVHELQEYHRCRKCPKIFEDYKSLKAHMKHQHKKRKCYICHYCSKNFVDRMFFKVHIKLHCDACGLLLPNKRKYSDHRRQVCRIVKKYECNTCHYLFFSFMDLKDHNYDHFESLFICDICKEQCGSKCEVTHHIAFLHSDRRPRDLYTMKNIGNEMLYLCNFCDTSSVDREMIENHVAVLPDLKNRAWTGYADFYFCDQCSKRFDTETSLVQHKWTHFLNTCDNSQIQQKNMLAKPEFDMNKTYKIHEKLPSIMQPRIVLQRIDDSLKDSNVSKSKSGNPKHIDSCKNSSNPKHSVNANYSNGPKYSNNANYSNGPKYSDSTKSPEKVGESSNIDLTAKKAVVDPQSQTTNESGDSSNLDLRTENVFVDPNSKKTNEFGESSNFDLTVKKAYVDPKSKKTLLSRFQCEKCNKYYSSNYCLNRHILSIHTDYSDLRCPECEETFVWPSLLKSHKCIRMNIPEMPFDDARAEIQLQEYSNFGQAGFDELMTMSYAENDDYINAVDFEIPAPIVELIEYENCANPHGNQSNSFSANSSNCYKIVVQEVPIEF